MRIALIHDWITGLRGGERCLDYFLKIYPEADIFTLLHVPGKTTERIDSRVKETSFLQTIPGNTRYYRHLLPLYPWAIQKFVLDDYDLVVSLSHAAAKNVTIRNPATTHVSYCFTPMRYIWDQAYEYFGSATPFLWPIINGLRTWDCKGSQSVSKFVGISKFVAARIRCYYGRDATVIHPPVELHWISQYAELESRNFKQGEAFLYAGALVPYKRPELVVRAFNQSKLPLWIVGTGPEEKRLKEMAGPNIQFFGQLTDAELASTYAHSRALIFPGVEDFGMIPIECMAAGRPVIGLYGGGLKETIKGLKPWKPLAAQLEAEKDPGYTGVFIPTVSSDPITALNSSIYYFVDHEERFTSAACRAQAELFNGDQFHQNWRREIMGQKFAPTTATRTDRKIAGHA